MLATSVLRPGTYAVDPARGRVDFTVEHVGMPTVSGRFARFGGEVSVGADGHVVAARGAVEAASVSTGVRRRDDFLASERFFDVGACPAITFEADQVHSGPTGELELHGPLTIAGRACPLTLTGQVRDTGAGRLWVELSGTIRRSRYGLRFPQWLGAGDRLVADDVHVRIAARAGR
ncbi:MAG TPA: YceI family protein [Baekduia sp.]|nr:YceI family protein [Baekduia sp.]